ncbi:MarR family transcriptional regulator [Streptomyces tateyamensis]|uniref:MarR family transcriptional regulator n=1 Tax=Streptomyces tateyamensis TaxID=565073 RepID=A0A2V4MWJ1_9ACTN|nr:MarR family transcriptional regulator [Streptomyces tateyamensis]PYC73035.1 MarR family transcriptional regulator [Streptomyces tateyamensis]
MSERDALDVITDQWAGERPDLDLVPIALIGRLKRVHQHVDQGMRDHFAQYGLDVSEFDVLATLRRSAPSYQLTAGALLQSAMVTSGAITNRVDRLVAKGLVERRPSPTDRRAVLIGLTPAGWELIDSMLTGHVANEERLIGALTGEERAQLSALLGKLLRTYEGTDR